MTTEETTTTTNEQTEETVTELETDVIGEAGGYAAPLVKVSASPGDPAGEYLGTLHVEIGDGQWAETGGDVAVVTKAVVEAVVGVFPHLSRPKPGPDTPRYEVRFDPVELSPRLMEVFMRRFEESARRPSPSPERVEEALEQAEADAEQCAREHEERVTLLRNLVLQARSDKRAADQAATEAAVADGQAFGSGGLRLNTDARGEAETVPTSDQVADAAAGEGSEGGDR